MKKVYIFILCVFITNLITAQNNPIPSDTLGVNNILEWIRADGYDSYDPIHGSSGFYYWPDHQISMQCVYLEGLQWGGMVDTSIKIGGTWYYESNKTLNESGSYKSYSGLWKIRKDWESLPEGELKTQLQNDYDNWPVDLGAPWVDTNNDGVFTKGVDTPDFLGDEVLYTVYKPAESSNFSEFYATKPYNVEIHETVYAFNSPDYLRDVLFKKYDLINKGESVLKDFYIAYWADVDLGFAGDDYIGCDSSLFLGYVFNEDTLDSWFHPNNPAIGHIILKGLENDSGNLMMSAFNPNFKNAFFSHDPGDASEYYNMVKGLLNNGKKWVNPFTNQETSFPFSGNPVTGEGWYEGGDWPPSELFDDLIPSSGDRRYYLSSGPVDFAPGDTQTVVVAELVAVDETNLSVINKLKNLAEKIHVFYGNDFVVKVGGNAEQIPAELKLYQNYPNPFNPATLIRYSVPNNLVNNIERTKRGNTNNFSLSTVSLKIYDVLGREIATLVNAKQQAGNYEVTFNARNLPSGVYIYRLTLSAGENQKGIYSLAKKMILVK